MNIDECIKILDAVRQQKPVEYRFRGDDVWKDLLMEDSRVDNVTLNFHKKEYRLKKPISYTPYIEMYEFVDEACNHKCMLMRRRDAEEILVPSIITNNGVQCGDYHFNYSELLDKVVWYDDGTPVGMKL